MSLINVNVKVKTTHILVKSDKYYSLKYTNMRKTEQKMHDIHFTRQTSMSFAHTPMPMSRNQLLERQQIILHPFMI